MLENRFEAGPEPLLRLHEISKVYPKAPEKPALQGVDFQVQAGQMVCVVGPSGCGKSTLLRIIAGLESPSSGQVFFEGQDLAQAPIAQRRAPLVPSGFSLFSHLSVEQNIAFALESTTLSRRDRAEALNVAMTSFNLEALAQMAPDDLSNGQAQRVAFARALVLRPRLLLLDEPFSGFDPVARQNARRDLVRLQRRLGISVLYVTHDRDEALSMADVLLVLWDGRVQQYAGAQEIYARPVSVFAAQGSGDANFLSFRLLEKTGECLCLELLGQCLEICAPLPEPALLMVRPEAVFLRSCSDSRSHEVYASHGRIISGAYFGSRMEYLVETELGTIISSQLFLGFDQEFRRGQCVEVRINPAGCWVVPAV